MGVAVGADVEAGGFLRAQKARDRVLVLLAVAELTMASRKLRGPPTPVSPRRRGGGPMTGGGGTPPPPPLPSVPPPLPAGGGGGRRPAGRGPLRRPRAPPLGGARAPRGGGRGGAPGGAGIG